MDSSKADDIQVTMNPQEIAEIQKAIDWVKQWYADRAKLIRPDGLPYLTENEEKLIQSRLTDLKVLVSEHPFLELFQEVLAGRLHLRTKLPDNYQLTPAEIKRLKQASKDMVGFYSPSLKEPSVFLNPKELLDANLHWETSETGTVNGTLSKAAVHEITHAVTAGLRNELVIESSLSQMTSRTRDTYIDNPSEIYARIAELRYNLNVEPNHVFTLQEIQKLRSKAEADIKQYKKEVKEIGKKNIDTLDKLPLKDKLFDHQLFIRYSDEEILHFLNDTAFRDNNELDHEHNWMATQDKVNAKIIAEPKIKIESNVEKTIKHLRFKA